ncbi:Methyltransferase domain protein [compost metagenome]
MRRHFVGQVVDIGIGGGRFVTEAEAMGFDVNAEAVAWLERQGRFYDPYRHHAEAVTCWDSLEHIPEPEKLLAQVGEWLFVSMPIYDSQAHCLQSKHFKPGEHIHYFTLNGFITWCQRQGFELVEINQVESELGREGITSFAFRRMHG